MRGTGLLAASALVAGLLCLAALPAPARAEEKMAPKMVRILKSDGKRQVVEEPFGEIDTAALDVLRDCGVSLVILDARPAAADDGRRIPGAKAVGSKDPHEAIAAAVQPSNAVIVTYSTGLAAPEAHQLALRLREMGYRFILEYPHGIEGWASLGRKVESAEKRK